MAHTKSLLRLSVVAGAAMMLAVSRGAAAQDARPPAAVETSVGYGWVDDDSGNHGLVGAGLRFYVLPRLSVNPRVTFQRTFRETPDDHTDLDLETALTFEFRRPAHSRPRMVSPFMNVSGGVRVQRFRGGRDFTEQTRTQGVWGVMFGARLILPFARGRMYVAPEVGIAPLLYPHSMMTEDPLITVTAPVTVGMALAPM